MVKVSACNVGDLGLIPGSGRSPGEGNYNTLQYSCLENPMEEPHGLQSMRSQRVGHNWAHVHTSFIQVWNQLVSQCTTIIIIVVTDVAALTIL